MTVPPGELEVVSGTVSETEVAPSSDHPPTPGIAARSPRQLVWGRLRRDRGALVGAVIVAGVLVTAIFGPWINDLLGNQPNAFHSGMIDADTSLPYGSFGGASIHHLLGVEPINGRDVLARLIAGARTSMFVSLTATSFSLGLGIGVGVVAGYYRGAIDTVLSRIMDVLLVFPVLLFSIAILDILGGSVSFAGLSGPVLNYAVLIFVIGFFSFPYAGRVIRGQVISLREREFVDAARCLGASNRWILVHEILPNLVSPILILTTLTVPTFVMSEAGLSFLGVGIQPPTASWGQMLAISGNWFRLDPTYLLWPGLTLFVVVLGFNVFGDALSDALDPRLTS